MPKKKKDIGTIEFLQELDEMVSDLGGVPKAARAMDVSATFLRRVIKAEKTPGDKIVACMGFIKKEGSKQILYRYERV